VITRQSLLLISGLVTLTWLAIVFRARLNLRRILWLNPVPAEGTSDGLVSVIVPARNEAGAIGPALRSILEQEGVEVEVIAVDDHSEDATGAEMDEWAQRDPRLRVIHAPALKPGWLGKANAMQAGLEQARGEWILFCDGDVRHRPGCFAAALADLRRFSYDMISGLPHLEVRLFWEHVMLPMLVSGLAKLVPEGRQQDPQTKEAVASGALMLIKRGALEAIGGLESIRGEIADDVSLARRVKRHGLRAGYRLAPALMEIRLFKSNREAFVSTSKNILLVIEESKWLAPVLPLYTMALFWLPWLLAGLGLAGGDWIMAAAGLALYLIQYAGLFVSRRVFSFRPLPALAFPLVALIVGYCASRAYWLHLRGSIEWRGRTIRVK
jgi:glycosyltransferase involved in cell wall biosynthesis